MPKPINFAQQEKIKLFLEKHLIATATPMVEYLENNEQFAYSDYSDQVNELCFVPDLKELSEQLEEREDVWIITPDNPIQGLYTEFFLDLDAEFLIIKFETITDRAQTEQEAWDLYAKCGEKRYLYPKDYLVCYQKQYSFIRNVNVISSGDSLEEALKEAWYLESDPPSIKPSEYYIVSQFLAKHLAEQNQPLAVIFNWHIWGRIDCGSAIHHDSVIQEIVTVAERGEKVENLKLRLQALVSTFKNVSEAFVKELTLATINDGYLYNRLKALDFQWARKLKDLDWLDQQLSSFTILAIKRYVKTQYSSGTDWSDVCNQEDIEALKLRILEYYTYPGDVLLFK